jgi:hypothetical protein
VLSGPSARLVVGDRRTRIWRKRGESLRIMHPMNIPALLVFTAEMYVYAPELSMLDLVATLACVWR